MNRIVTAIFSAATALMLLFSAPAAKADGFINFGPAKQFVELDVHLLAGGSGVTQNYQGSFAEIRELNESMGSSFGVGAGAVFGLSDFLGLGTQLNFTFNHNKMTIAVSSDGVTSVSNVFLSNRYLYANIPVFLSFRFNVLGSIRWNVDAGMYYSYGLTGSQKQSIFNSTVNDLGQLISRVVETKPDYFGSTQTFINSFYRSDLGLHLATGLQFGRHITLGCQFQVGFKNVAYTSGVINPNVHNISLLASVGYKF